MNTTEVNKILMIITSVYPLTTKNFSDGQKAIYAQVWQEQLANYDYAFIKANLDNYISSHKYAPSISDLNGKGDPKEVKQAIPDVVQTRQYLLEQQLALPAEPSDPERIARLREQAMKEIAAGAAMNAARNRRKEWHPDDEEI